VKIAFFDYVVTRDNAIGKCDLTLLGSLCHEHDFTVFSVRFDNPNPQKIRWVRVPAPTRPLALLFLVFHVMALLCYAWHCLRHRVRFDCVQFIESNLTFGRIAYPHFCHRAFLQNHWSATNANGLRGFARWLDHWLHARFEPLAFRRASWIVTPSHGLARELAAAYPDFASKLRVVANPVDLPAFNAPDHFDRAGAREKLGIAPDEIALAFVALAHYERKGLPLLLQALADTADFKLKVLVVGGSPTAIADYRSRADKIGLNGNVSFYETQRDIRPYLWAADALALPSHYEVFPLAALEAAAAGLPLLAAPLNGVEEFLSDPDNGMLMQRTVPDISACLTRFAALSPEARTYMGRRARATVQKYGAEAFAAAWSNLYKEVAADGRTGK
jgi:glycosyltransferase involved in cell wall biosynthesis